jgi:primosomal protein N' (replication factor Y)
LASRAKTGCRVTAPFGKQQVTGYILEQKAMEPEDLFRDIKEVLDDEPLFPETMVPFFRWMSDYYFYPIGRLIQSALPAGINRSPFKGARITEQGLRAMKLLKPGSKEAGLLSRVHAHPEKRIPPPLHLAYTLQRKGWLVLEDRTRKRRVGPLMRKFVRPREDADLEELLKEKAGTFRARDEQVFLRTVLESRGVPLLELSAKFSNGPYLVNKWVQAGMLETYEAAVFRNPEGNLIIPTPVPDRLYPQQAKALDDVQRRLEKGTFSTCLLHGVTGSGKTEVYLRAIQHATGLGRQAIFMVPEIALAVYLEGICRRRFNDRLAILHSGLSGGERYDQWTRIAQGEVDLVIGARSALFAPLSRLGLIIVDEEHDFSYKQDEGPRYQARDAAVVRARLERATVILGSGTPSIQSFYNGTTGRYGMLTMPDRIEQRPLPRVEVIDMKEDMEPGEKDGIISRTLKKALDETLGEGRQTILFLNRRGFHRVHLCRFCGETIRCCNCDLPMVYHLADDCLTCHYCNYQSSSESRCPACGREGIKAFGFGTERLARELSEAYPSIRVARMDRDSTRRKGFARRTLRKFSRGEIDVLVGTQMITKGYDFPNVTLVGVIAADFSLGFPDFRASERTFQILSQVAGRAGRGDRSGRVFIQTFNPGHYAITAARDHDYNTFFRMETELREQLGYPPFAFLARYRLQGNSQGKTSQVAEQVGKGMRGILERWPRRGREIQVLGPSEAPLSKIRGKYRWQILVKCKRAALLHYFLKEVEELSPRLLRGSGVSMGLDVDPYHML